MTNVTLLARRLRVEPSLCVLLDFTPLPVLDMLRRLLWVRRSRRAEPQADVIASSMSAWPGVPSNAHPRPPPSSLEAISSGSESDPSTLHLHSDHSDEAADADDERDHAPPLPYAFLSLRWRPPMLVRRAGERGQRITPPPLTRSQIHLLAVSAIFLSGVLGAFLSRDARGSVTDAMRRKVGACIASLVYVEGALCSFAVPLMLRSQGQPRPRPPPPHPETEAR